MRLGGERGASHAGVIERREVPPPGGCVYAEGFEDEFREFLGEGQRAESFSWRTEKAWKLKTYID